MRKKTVGQWAALTELVKKPKVLMGTIIFLLVLLILAIGPFSKQIRYDSDQRAVLADYDTYHNSFDTLNYDIAYESLTSVTRQNISKEEWIQKVDGMTGLTVSKVLGVVLLSPEKARVDIEARNVYGEKEKSVYSQFWFKEDGRWKRAYAEDNNLVTTDKSQQETVPPDRPEFQLVNLKRDWYTHRSSLQKETLFQPQVTFNVENSGSIRIDNFRILIEFYKAGTNNRFASTDTRVVGSSDRPLDPGHTTEKIFIRSSIGFVLNDLANPISRLEEILQISRENPVEARIYYKLKGDDEWEWLKTI